MKLTTVEDQAITARMAHIVGARDVRSFVSGDAVWGSPARCPMGLRQGRAVRRGDRRHIRLAYFDHRELREPQDSLRNGLTERNWPAKDVQFLFHHQIFDLSAEFVESKIDLATFSGRTISGRTARSVTTPSRLLPASSGRFGTARGGNRYSNQFREALLVCACRVTTGRNRDDGRGQFCRFLAATTTHRYALTSNLFPVCSTSPICSHECARVERI